jgi:capsular exopolysaccharide synthesis family protein
VDADLRQPRVHEMFGRDLQPGLSNLLVGRVNPGNAVKKTGVPGLWILPAGRIPLNPSELLSSSRFKNFVASLDTYFDCVVIDSPPVMAVTDAALVARASSGILFVVGAEMVSSREVSVALDRLGVAGTKVVGAVLNQVELDRHSYYYSTHYRRLESRDYRGQSSVR